MPSAGNTMRLLSGVRSDKGMQRSNNEDSVGLRGHERAVLAMVADGMGGAVAGEQASRIAVDRVQAHVLAHPFEDPIDLEPLPEEMILDRIVDAVRDANLAIMDRSNAVPELRGMGTTLTLALARGRDVVLAHVGDSRAYLIDGYDHSLTQLTRDHSFVQALLDAGHISAGEAEHHAMKNVLYRALGQIREIEIDLVSGVTLNPGDRIILCSDGLTLHVQQDEIRQIALADDNPEAIATHLVDPANQRGGRDNISVVVLMLQGGAPSTDTGNLSRLDYEDDDPTLPLL